MKWKKYTIKTTTGAEDFVSSMLADLGVEGVQIEDNVPLSQQDKEKLYIDILPVLPPDEGIAYISFFVGEDTDRNTLIQQVKEELEGLRVFAEVGEGSITEAETEDKDWINNWKQYFKAFTIDGIHIKPSWEKETECEAYDCVIEIDPGTSFGTGKHETTQLCIRQLRKYMQAGDRVLDVGFGSGILSIIALRLGAFDVTGTDVDPVCLEAVAENMQRNMPEDGRGKFYHGNLIDDKMLAEQVGTECFDVVVANILADIIIPLTPVIPDRLRKGGIYITSGIIDFKEDAVKQAMTEAGLEILEICRQGEWVSITARKK